MGNRQWAMGWGGDAQRDGRRMCLWGQGVIQERGTCASHCPLPIAHCPIPTTPYPPPVHERLTRIDDLDDPRLEVYRDQRDAWLKAAHNPDAPGPTTRTGLDDPGLFMTEAALVLDQHLRAPYPVESVLVATERVAALADLLARVPDSVPIYTAPRAMLSEIAGFAMHRGLLAVGRRLPDRDPIELARSRRTLVMLEDIANHDNVGSIFRSTAALAGDDGAVLLSPRSCDPLYRKALRVSIGCALRVPFATLDPWIGGLETLRAMDIPIVALTPDPDATPIDQIPDILGPSASVALLLGAEGPGLSAPALARATHRVRIPIVDWVDSLNIGVAAGVALAALGRAPLG